jgi:hypothetical protein
MPDVIALDEDLKRCEAEALAAERELAAAKDRELALAREAAANENTIPPLARVEDVIRCRDYDHAVRGNRRNRRNRALVIKMSLLLWLMAAAASVTLFLWGMRYLNGQ